MQKEKPLWFCGDAKEWQSISLPMRIHEKAKNMNPFVGKGR